MLKSRFFMVSLILLLTLSTFGGVTAAGAAPQNAGLKIDLSASQASFSAGEPVVVVLTISNPTGRAVKVLKWLTPAEDVEEPLFAISLSGSPAAYLGPVYKRPAITGADYIVLKPGDRLVRQVDLSTYYDFSASGEYTLAYDVASFQLHSEKTAGVWSGMDRLSSNELKVYVEGRAPTSASVSPAAVSGSSSFNKCTGSQQSSLLSARSQASTYSADGLLYLNANKQSSRYTTWFGIYDSSRYTTVKTHFSAITNAMDTAPVSFDCGCKKSYYAYVYPNKPYYIYLCRVFWTAPLTGTDSKAGTLIHEMSHFTVVAGTNDYVYGQTGAKSLAISNPNNAVNNADNHEYFAENTPALP